MLQGCAIMTTMEADHEHVVVYRGTSRSDANERALVLAAMGISSTLWPGKGGAVAVSVRADDALRAREQLIRYARENRRTGAPAATAPPPLMDGFIGAVMAAAVIVLLFAWSRQHAFFQDWSSAGAVQVGLMAQGQWWRAVTALGLHADLSHLASNLIFGSLFALVLAQSLGPGLAWLAILLGGAAGNVLNAAFQPPEHTAIGASTAVFAAVGILSGLSWRRQTLHWRRGLRRWTPVAGGLMLLVYLGLGGERTDIGAHIAGFVAGCAIGVALAYVHPWLPRGRRAQRVLGLGAAVFFVVAWAFALASVP